MLRGLFFSLLLGTASAAADPYVTANLGYASSDFSLDEPYNGSVDDEGLTYGVHLGYRFSDLLAVELGASRFGNLDGRASPCPAGDVCILVVRDIPDNDVNAYTASILPTLRMGDLGLFGRVGYYHADIDTNIPFPGNEFSENGWLLGAGARWRVSETWSLTLEASAHQDQIGLLNIAVGWHPHGFR